MNTKEWQGKGQRAETAVKTMHHIHVYTNIIHTNATHIHVHPHTCMALIKTCNQHLTDVQENGQELEVSSIICLFSDFFSMNHHMLFQVCRSFEASITNITLVTMTITVGQMVPL